MILPYIVSFLMHDVAMNSEVFLMHDVAMNSEFSFA